MARYFLERRGDVFTGQRIIGRAAYKDVFRVRGAAACKAMVQLLGIETPIQDLFFDTTCKIVHNYYAYAHDEEV